MNKKLPEAFIALIQKIRFYADDTKKRGNDKILKINFLIFSNRHLFGLRLGLAGFPRTYGGGGPLYQRKVFVCPDAFNNA